MLLLLSVCYDTAQAKEISAKWLKQLYSVRLKC